MILPIIHYESTSISYMPIIVHGPRSLTHARQRRKNLNAFITSDFILCSDRKVPNCDENTPYAKECFHWP
jgi:hypothetical protein